MSYTEKPNNCPYCGSLGQEAGQVRTSRGVRWRRYYGCHTAATERGPGGIDYEESHECFINVIRQRDEARGLIVDYTLAAEAERGDMGLQRSEDVAYRKLYDYGLKHWPQPREGE